MPGIMKIRKAKSGAYMQATAGGTDSAASSSYGTPTYSSSSSSSSSSSNQGNQGAGQSAPSAAPSASEIANTKSIKKKLKDSLENIVASQGQPGFETSGIAGQKIKGKNKDGQTVEMIIPSNVPASFHQFLINNQGNSAAQAILSNYAASGVNPYQQQIQDFKDTPGGLGVFKEKFPNPLVKIAGGIGDFFKKGTLLGKFLSSLNKSDQNKLGIITNDPQGVKIGPPAYDVNQYGLGNVYDDKILRDQLGMSFTGNPYDQMYGLPMADLTGAGPGPDNSMFSADLAYKKKIVDKFFGTNNNIKTPEKINYAYDYVMKKYEKNESSGEESISETMMKGASSPDFSNFQDEIVDEVTEKNQVGPNEDNMMGSENIFDFDSSALLGSDVSDVSETEYKENKEVFPNQFPIVNNPDSPYADLFPDSYAEQMDNMATGGYMSSFPNQNLNTQSLSASDNIDDRIMKNLQFEKMSPGMMGYNAGGYAGMSTFDKLKMIADSGYQS
tara:strand:+ start:307 stop:1803 length:1497 start_codon:yes stop_codon:yes gene_type:complete